MTSHSFRLGAVGLAIASIAAIGACSDSGTGSGTGAMRVQLTDAPFSSDSVSRVDLFVVRVDARIDAADSATAAKGAADDSATVSGWTTIAAPKAKIELLALRNGLFTTLGTQTVPSGSYQALRLIIDPSQSSVTL